MIKFEYFNLVEKYDPVGITASEFSNHVGLPIQQARNWLSLWTQRGYLKLISKKREGEFYKEGRGRPKGTEGRYAIGKKSWVELVNKSALSGDSGVHEEYQ